MLLPLSASAPSVLLTGVVVGMWDKEKLQRLLVPLIATVTDLKPLFPDAAVRVVKRQEVVNIQQLNQ